MIIELCKLVEGVGRCKLNGFEVVHTASYRRTKHIIYIFFFKCLKCSFNFAKCSIQNNKDFHASCSHLDPFNVGIHKVFT